MSKGTSMRATTIHSFVLVALATVAAGAQPTGGFFVATIGKDTLAVEQYTVTSKGIEGVSVIRYPRTSVRTYSMTFGENGRFERFRMTVQPFGQPVATEREYTYADDSVQVMFKQDTLVRRFWAPVAGRLAPLFEDIFAFWNESTRRAVAAGAGTVSFLGGRRPLVYAISKTGTSTVDLVDAANDFGPMHAVLRTDGQIDRFDMTSTTDKYVVERVASLDVQALGASFAAREQAGQRAGALSPRDTARAVVNGARVLVDYGRPSMRGRVIFGNVVPWDEVWRMGANAATQLITDKPLTFGSVTVPPGTYSLFSIPGKKGWTLIINSQHGQWGTQYDASKDLARIPLETTPLSDPVEQLTVTIVPNGAGASLVLRWEKVEAVARFAVK